jgi:hypothetical protein
MLYQNDILFLSLHFQNKVERFETLATTEKNAKNNTASLYSARFYFSSPLLIV